MEAAIPILESLRLPIAMEFGEIGWECWRSQGNPIPEETWRRIEVSDATLLGAITSKGMSEAEEELAPQLRGQNLKYVSPVVQLRQRLDLYANVRPAFALVGNRKPFRCCVIRENTEGLYAGIDRHGVPNDLRDVLSHPNVKRSGSENATYSVRLQTRFALERIYTYAFRHAVSEGYDRVTLADKPNVLRESGQFAADIFHSVAADFPGITADIQNVDAAALWLERRPEKFGVIVAENMFGDILSDLLGGVMGGLGLAPSANIGAQQCYFEPVHGSAPGLAGKGRANPSAMLLSAALMLRHLDFVDSAERIEQAVRSVILQGRTVTYDLGGIASTQAMAKAILAELEAPGRRLRASVLCIGNELLRGDVVNSNAAEFGKRLEAAGYQTVLQLTCGDRMAGIRNAMDICLGQSDVVVVNGGLGPTSDDLTREGISAALDAPLIFDDASWQAIHKRLTQFGLPVHDSNRKQAMFPRGATILPNPRGTAAGFTLHWKERVIHVLPGPPRECLAMLDTLLVEHAGAARESHEWRLLGVLEGDIADAVDKIIAPLGDQAEVAYRWHYPYVDVRLILPSRSRDRSEVVDAIERLVQDSVVSRNGQTAIEQLSDIREKYRIEIQDDMTSGAFIGRLPNLSRDDAPLIRIAASLGNARPREYIGTLDLICNIQCEDTAQVFMHSISNRGPEVVEYMCEFIAWSVLRSIEQQDGRLHGVAHTRENAHRSNF